jgi:hypothetical protein
MTSKPKQHARAKSAPNKAKRSAKGRAAAKPAVGKAEKSGRLRPGAMDGLVLACLRDHRSEWPMTATAVAKVLGHSSGAVANCLRRLAEAKPRQVRLATREPRAYDLKGVKDAKA